MRLYGFDERRGEPSYNEYNQLIPGDVEYTVNGITLRNLTGVTGNHKFLWELAEQPWLNTAPAWQYMDVLAIRTKMPVDFYDSITEIVSEYGDQYNVWLKVAFYRFLRDSHTRQELNALFTRNSQELRNDHDLFRKLLPKCPWALQFASEEIKDDYDLVESALEVHGCCFGCVSARLRDNNYIAGTALRTSPKWAMPYLSPRLRKDADFIGWHSEPVLDKAYWPEESNPFDSQQYVIEHVLSSPNHPELELITDRLRNDIDFICRAVEYRDGYSIASDDLKNDMTVIEELLDKRGPIALRVIPKHLRKNKDLVLKAVRGGSLSNARDKPIRKVLPVRSLRDKEVVLAIFECYCMKLKDIPKELWDDKEIIEQVLIYHPEYLDEVPEKFRENEEFVFEIKRMSDEFWHECNYRNEHRIHLRGYWEYAETYYNELRAEKMDWERLLKTSERSDLDEITEPPESRGNESDEFEAGQTPKKLRAA